MRVPPAAGVDAGDLFRLLQDALCKEESEGQGDVFARGSHGNGDAVPGLSAGAVGQQSYFKGFLSGQVILHGGGEDAFYLEDIRFFDALHKGVFIAFGLISLKLCYEM